MQLNNTVLTQIKEAMNHQQDSFFQLTLPQETDFDCLQVASQSNVDEIIYFSKPKQSIEYLAFGAWRVLNNADLKRILDSNNSDTRWFGINAFSSKSKKIAEYWVLPKVWFEKSNRKVQLNIVIDLENSTKDACLESILKIIEKIDTTKKPIEEQVYVNQSHVPEKAAWVNMVNEAQQKIGNKALKKVVLARQSTYEFKNKVNPFLLLKKVQDKDLKRKGTFGDTIEVADGYARNYLIPNGFALIANNANKKRFEEMKDKALANVTELRTRLKTTANQIKGKTFTMTALSRDGKLYGSITPSVIVNDMIHKELPDLDINASDVIIEEGNIKFVGTYECKAQFTKDIFSSFTIVIESDESDEQPELLEAILEADETSEDDVLEDNTHTDETSDDVDSDDGVDDTVLVEDETETDASNSESAGLAEHSDDNDN